MTIATGVPIETSRGPSLRSGDRGDVREASLAVPVAAWISRLPFGAILLDEGVMASSPP
jgi:hypothetical protein